MPKESNHKNVRDLADKGEGVLVRHGNVWSYPGVEIDPSGTNLRLPVEYVTDEQVKAAMADETFVSTTIDAVGTVRAIRLKGDDDATVITTAQAGTAEVGTELLPGSRPSVDAGAHNVSQAESASLAQSSLATVIKEPVPPAPAATAKPADAKAK